MKRSQRKTKECQNDATVNYWMVQNTLQWQANPNEILGTKYMSVSSTIWLYRARDDIA